MNEPVHAWIDASAGIAGDMLLGALVDAGADLEAVRGAVDAVVPRAVAVSAREVTRAGQRATKIEIEPQTDDLPERHWSTIRTMITAADLEPGVRDRALRVFAVLAEAEGRVHGIAAEGVHFHEVGALDSITDVIGVAAAFESLGVTSVSVGVVAVGSGRTRMAHGDVPIPVPAVLELSRGWTVTAGGVGELTTPTGMALIAALAERSEDLPAMMVTGSGAGAGTKDIPGRPNLTRVVLGTRSAAPDVGEAGVVLEANVDDLDPRLWPGVLDALLDAGAADAWLSPILMKKGRAAHVLSVLCRPAQAADLRTVVFARTSTFGVRQSEVVKHALPRRWAEVSVAGEPVRIKIAHRDGAVVRATPEFADVEALARRTDRPTVDLLAEAVVAAAAAGIVSGATIPDIAVD